MNAILKAGVALAMLAGAGTPAFAQSNSASTNATTTIIRPVTISKVDDLAFGKIVKPSAAGNSTIEIGTGADTASVTAGSAVLLTSTRSRAEYDINGEGGQAVTVTVNSGSSTFNMTRSGGSETIQVTLLGIPGSAVTLDSSLGSAGTYKLYLGGNITISDETATGAYTGSFNVNVAYQ
ncbi:MAG TPA: DUF4402 domain-containing protein [Allosphingosinicella sp.]|nr:DUF4402 domain-containing protein [Allosphingosinicella sp.]